MARPRTPLPLLVIAVVFGLLVLSTFTWLAAAFCLVLPVWYLLSHFAYEQIVGWLGDIACAWTFPTFQKYSKLQVYLFGQGIAFPSSKEKSICMFNHQSWCDVPILNGFLFFHNVMARALWVGWRGLLKFPFAWAGVLRGDVWIPCKWPTDKPYLDRSIKQLLDSRQFHYYCFFPEGALKSRKTMEKCHTFCQENGYPKLQYLLWPRNRAFIHIVEAIRKAPGARFLYDFTVAYEGFGEGRAPGILDLFTRHAFSTRIYIHGRRFLISDLPTGEEALATWLNNLYVEKDQLLKYFWKHKTFPSNVEKHVTPSLAMVTSRVGMRPDVDAPRPSSQAADATLASAAVEEQVLLRQRNAETQSANQTTATAALVASEHTYDSWKPSPVIETDYRHVRSLTYAFLFFSLNALVYHGAKACWHWVLQ